VSTDPNNEEKEKYVSTLMGSEDSNVLRAMLFESLTVVGRLYKKVQMHILLHPLFFLAGFILGFYFGVHNAG